MAPHRDERCDGVVGVICVKPADGFGHAMSNDEPSPAEPAFWDRRYAAGRMPWDAGGAQPRLARFLNENGAPGRALIPGCGSGYEVAALARAGWDVNAIDFSAVAVDRARRLLGPDLGARAREGDFFTAELPAGAFDLVYERTFFCALSLPQREAYVARMAELLRAGGRLVGFFYTGDERDGPPHQLNATDERTLFRPRFELLNEEVVADSMAFFEGNERWREYRRR